MDTFRSIADDDALLDRLGAGGPSGWDDPVAQALHAWALEVDPHRASGRLPRRLRRGSVVPLVSALVLTVGGSSVAAALTGADVPVLSDVGRELVDWAPGLDSWTPSPPPRQGGTAAAELDGADEPPTGPSGSGASISHGHATEVAGPTRAERPDADAAVDGWTQALLADADAQPFVAVADAPRAAQQPRAVRPGAPATPEAAAPPAAVAEGSGVGTGDTPGAERPPDTAGRPLPGTTAPAQPEAPGAGPAPARPGAGTSAQAPEKPGVGGGSSQRPPVPSSPVAGGRPAEQGPPSAGNASPTRPAQAGPRPTGPAQSSRPATPADQRPPVDRQPPSRTRAPGGQGPSAEPARPPEPPRPTEAGRPTEPGRPAEPGRPGEPGPPTDSPPSSNPSRTTEGGAPGGAGRPQG